MFTPSQNGRDKVTRDVLSGRVKHYLDGLSSVPLLRVALGA
jgi:hypothetical protein